MLTVLSTMLICYKQDYVCNTLITVAEHILCCKILLSNISIIITALFGFYKEEQDMVPVLEVLQAALGENTFI